MSDIMSADLAFCQGQGPYSYQVRAHYPRLLNGADTSRTNYRTFGITADIVHKNELDHDGVRR